MCTELTFKTDTECKYLLPACKDNSLVVVSSNHLVYLCLFLSGFHLSCTARDTTDKMTLSLCNQAWHSSVCILITESRQRPHLDLRTLSNPLSHNFMYLCSEIKKLLDNFRENAQICCSRKARHTHTHRNHHCYPQSDWVSGIKIHHLVIKIADVSITRHASWISWAAAWIPGSAGQGQPAKLPCAVMPLPDSGWYTRWAVRVRQAVGRWTGIEDG